MFKKKKYRKSVVQTNMIYLECTYDIENTKCSNGTYFVMNAIIPATTIMDTTDTRTVMMMMVPEIYIHKLDLSLEL